MNLEDVNYKFNYHDIEDIWQIFFCLSDTTFLSIKSSFGKKGAYRLSCEAMMSTCIQKNEGYRMRFMAGYYIKNELMINSD